MNVFFGSMGGRVFLILLGGILASAALTLFLANRDRHEFFEHVRIFHAAERMTQTVGMLEAVPAPVRASLLTALDRQGLVAEIGSSAAVSAPDPFLTAQLQERLGPSYRVEAGRAPCLPQVAVSPNAAATEPLCRAARIALRDGSVLYLAFPPQPDRPAAQTIPHLALFGLMFAASLGLLAYVVARMATRPLRHLAEAASELGRNIERAPLVEKGPSEVRHAASAFNAMQAQIQHYIRERTQLLAAITHDLQTPLTRMRLRLEKVQEGELREKLTGDLAAMHDMIRDGLDLARSMNSGEAAQRMDLDSMLNSVCDDAAEAGQDVTLEGSTGASITAQPSAIRRCLTNLIDNAVKYGGHARVSVSLGREHVIVRVRDGGPGIPEAQLEAVFTPFFRLEGSRSRETGGTGIGLSIARNIVEKHGGSVYLRNHPQGGLEAVVELPLA
jgi:signal transduction histidine kinase